MQQGTTESIERRCEAVVLDLDGTLLDTERLVDEVVAAVLRRHGCTLDPELAASLRGQRPLDACAAVVAARALAVTPEALHAETDAALSRRWAEASLLPGTERLIRHLRAHGVRLALCTSTSRAVLALKAVRLGSLVDAFEAVVCGDDCALGKPHPEPYVRAAAALGLPPERCLAVEDATSGVLSARAAGCCVLAVPSSPVRAPFEGERTVVVHSLLDARPELWGLPPFVDYVCRTLPLASPLRLRGTVIRGVGRGSAALGIPTANLDAAAFPELGHSAVVGIYGGWACVGAQRTVHKAAVSIGATGYNPHFPGQVVKTVEPWLLADFAAPFYGEELRLLVCAYIRPEAAFTNLESLVAQIHDDAAVTRAALDTPAYIHHAADPFLRPAECG